MKMSKDVKGDLWKKEEDKCKQPHPGFELELLNL